jgi:hypothetical protein
MCSIRTVTTSRLSVTRRSDFGRDAAGASDPRGVSVLASSGRPGPATESNTHAVTAEDPKAAHGIVATYVRTIFAQPDAESVRAQHARTVEHLRGRFQRAADMLADAAEELLAFTVFPKEHWRQIWSNNPQERLNREIRRLGCRPSLHDHQPRGARGGAEDAEASAEEARRVVSPTG